MKPNMPSLFDDDFFSEYEKKEPAAEAPGEAPDKAETASEKSEIREEPDAGKSSEEKAPDPPPAKASDPSEAEASSDSGSDAAPLKKPEVDKPPADKETTSPPAASIPRSRPALELPGGEADDKELDQQIRTELIQSDYAAMIHKDYPFSPGQVEFVTRDSGSGEEKEKKVAARAAGKGKKETPEDTTGISGQEEPHPTLPQWQLKKNYYTIGEVARLFDVNISHIRFWTNEFKLKPRTNRKGDRLYTPAHIDTLRLIHYLVKVKKFTLKGAKEKLKSGKEAVNHQLVLKDSLIELRNALMEIKAGLE